MVNPKFIAKIESEEPTLRFAVLIDADNVSASVIEGLLAEIATFGEATVKRIYGDFTSPTSAQWKKVLNKNAIKPVQQFAYTTGKNATDSTLIIDAMDLLYTRRFNGFCLVSSDSDFTGLAIRIREEGLTVLGFGEQKTPEAFRNACHKFILTEVLRPVDSKDNETALTPIFEIKKTKIPLVATNPIASVADQTTNEIPIAFLLQSLEKTCDENGWARLADFGSYLTKLQPDFEPRSFGFKKLSELIKAKPGIFHLEERQVSNSSGKVLCVCAKK